MPSPHLQIPDIPENTNQPEVIANDQTERLDRAMNQVVTKTITGNTTFTTTETRENTLIILTGTPGAPFTVDMPDTNERKLNIRNDTDGDATIRNSAGGGADQPVLAADGGRTVFQYDGTDFNELGVSSTLLTTQATPGLFWAKVRKNADQLINNSTNTALTFQTVVDDTSGFYSGGSPDRLTVPAGQGYLVGEVTAGVNWAGQADANYRLATIQRNGSGIAASNNDGSTNVAGAIRHNLSTGPIPLSDGDFFQVFAFQTSGVSQNVIFAAPETWISIKILEVAGTPLEPVEHFEPGVVAGSTLLYLKTANRPFKLADEFLNSQAFAVTAPAGGSAVFDVERNGAVIGTITFAAASQTATFTTTAATEELFAVGDRLGIRSQAALNGIADVAFNLFAWGGA